MTGRRRKRIISKIRVFESSLVATGAAGPGRTRTRSLKCRGCGGHDEHHVGAQCDPCADRAEWRRQRDRFEAMKARLDYGDLVEQHRPGSMAYMKRHEISAAEVHPEIRHYAGEGAALATAILTPDDDAPGVRWYPEHVAADTKAHGMYFHGDDNIWLCALENLDRVFDCAAHEGAHRARPDWPEQKVATFAKRLQALRWKHGRLYVGTRRQLQNAPYVQNGGVIIDPDTLEVFQKDRFDWLPIGSLNAE